jgi:hypothetical protein
MKKILVIAFFACLFAAPALAQGGKAEPNRIQFKKGATSATVSAAISGDAQAEYVFGANAGQKIIVTVTRGASFELYDPAGGIIKTANNSTSFTIRATDTGDYRLNVTRLSAAPRKLNYKLTLSIQ